MSDQQNYQCPWDGTERRDGQDRRITQMPPPPNWPPYGYPYYGSPVPPSTPPHNSNRVTLEVKDFLSLALLIGGLIGTWVTLNNTITTEKIKLEQLEKNFVQLERNTTSLQTEIAEQYKQHQLAISELKNQIRDVEVSVQNVYQRVSSKR